MEHLDTAALTAGLDHIRRAPADDGELCLIVRRPAVDEREVLEVGELDPAVGLVGDTWQQRGSRHTDDGSAEPARQVTLMNARVVELLAGDRDRWPLAGDQLYVDLDLSDDNVPPGTRLAIGDAVVEVTTEPHNGCAKFSQRYGADAVRWVNTPIGKQLHLRGINASVVSGGTIRAADRVRKV